MFSERQRRATQIETIKEMGEKAQAFPGWKYIYRCETDWLASVLAYLK